MPAAPADRARRRAITGLHGRPASSQAPALLALEPARPRHASSNGHLLETKPCAPVSLSPAARRLRPDREQGRRPARPRSRSRRRAPRSDRGRPRPAARVQRQRAPAAAATRSGRDARRPRAARSGRPPHAPPRPAADRRLSRLPGEGVGLTLCALAASQRGGRTASCAAVSYPARWADRLPPGLALRPDARMAEAAGSNAGECRLRAVSYATAAGPAKPLD